MKHVLVPIATVAACLALSACAVLAPSSSPSPALQPARFTAIDQAIESFIERRQLPGAVFHLERHGQVYEKAYGRETYEADAPAITADTLFDAASLTKVVATAPTVMKLVEMGKLQLDAPLMRYLPECAGDGRDGITLRHLLTHTSGLPAGIPAKPAWRGEDAALKLACAQLPTSPPGTAFRYSDVNFILLGQIAQRAGGMPLEELAARYLYRPLAMRDTGFHPLRRFPSARIAPTQKSAAVETSLHGDLEQGATLRGVVHDPTTRFMGGAAGSAGLFTTARDLARFARMLLNEGELDGVRVLSAESVRLMRTVQSAEAVPARRSAGWDVDSPYSRPRGALFPIGSFGHTGFTGCILWIDPFSKTFYVFLSNRVYPDDKANIVPLYGQLGTLAAEAVADFDFMRVAGALPRRESTITFAPAATPAR